MKLKQLNETPFLKKGGYDTVDFWPVRNEVEKFIRANYKRDGGAALKTLDDVAKSIQDMLNSSVQSLKDFDEVYNNSVSNWVADNKETIRTLVYNNL